MLLLHQQREIGGLSEDRTQFSRFKRADFTIKVYRPKLVAPERFELSRSLQATDSKSVSSAFRQGAEI